MIKASKSARQAAWPYLSKAFTLWAMLRCVTRVSTLNVNGLRSALRKGLEAWLEQHQPDIVLLQEVRAEAMPETFTALGYYSCWNAAQKAGYSGVAILSKEAQSDVQVGTGHALLDSEGRVLAATIAGVRYASVYLPSGSSGEARQAVKDEALIHMLAFTKQQLALHPALVMGGDFNVAHTELDIKNWRANQKNSGFLPHERQWLSDMLSLGLRDAHREHLALKPEGEQREYTWWSNRANAYANNVGWRIDYLLSAGVALRDVWVEREQRFSDHAPLSAVLEPILAAAEQ